MSFRDFGWHRRSWPASVDFSVGGPTSDAKTGPFVPTPSLHPHFAGAFCASRIDCGVFRRSPSLALFSPAKCGTEMAFDPGEENLAIGYAKTSDVADAGLFADYRVRPVAYPRTSHGEFHGLGHKPGQWMAVAGSRRVVTNTAPYSNPEVRSWLPDTEGMLHDTEQAVGTPPSHCSRCTRPRDAQRYRPPTDSKTNGALGAQRSPAWRVLSP